jgi:hypothetical protein
LWIGNLISTVSVLAAGEIMAERGRPGRRWRMVLSGIATAVALIAASAAALPSASAATVAPGRVVNYHGYQVTVPASWPVYNLAADPTRCVLFNKDAVYLGTPGADQACPARAYGHTNAILIQPATGSAAVSPSAVQLPDDTAALPEQTAALPAAAAKADATSHTIQLDVPGPGVLVTATYGADQTLIRSILAGATATSASAASSAAGTRAPASAAANASTTATPKAATPNTATRKAASPKTATARNLTGIETTGLGFDACTAPSEATMKDWLASPYRVIGTYLGGVNWACSYGNFTADWVQQVASEGWRFIPIWVGEQASCSTIQGAALINPADAAAEGTAEAASAVSTAESYGYGKGSTLYYDMEGYDNSNATCSQGVLTFLSAWTQGLHAAGYLSGVYSSAGSGITDLAAQYGGTTYTSPDDIWIADWDGNPVLADPYVPAADWANGQRLRQYAGGHNETWGGATINIDSDVIGAPVSGLPGARLDAGPADVNGTDALTVSPGGTGTARLTVGGATGEQWHVTAPAGLTVWPSRGVVLPDLGHAPNVTLLVHASSSLATGRYDVPVTFSRGGKTVAETFELVSVTPAGTTLPTSSPIVLYAADSTSMTSAAAIARADALPAGDVTGDYSQAWSDLEGGKDIVIVVGTDAVDALFENACGWSNPDGLPAGQTPFYWLGTPFSQPPGADVYVPANGTTPANSALLAAQLTHFALVGTLPDYGRPPTQLPRPTDTCAGSANVPVP